MTCYVTLEKAFAFQWLSAGPCGRSNNRTHWSYPIMQDADTLLVMQKFHEKAEHGAATAGITEGSRGMREASK